MLDHTFKLHAVEAAIAGAVDSALLYQQRAAKTGIKIRVVREPNGGHWSNVLIKNSWRMCYWCGSVTPDWIFTTTYAGDANWNDMF